MKRILSIKVLIIQRLICSIIYCFSSFLLWNKIYRNNGLAGWSILDGMVLFAIIIFLQITLAIGVEGIYKEIDPINSLFYFLYRIIEGLQLGVLVLSYMLVSDGIFNPTKYMICTLMHMIVFGVVLCLHVRVLENYNALEPDYIADKIRTFGVEEQEIDLRKLYVLFGYIVAVCVLGEYYLKNILCLISFIVINTIILYKLLFELYRRLHKKWSLWSAIVISDFGIVIVYFINMNKKLFWLFKDRTADEMAMVVILFYFMIYKDLIPVYLRNRRITYEWRR